MSLSRNAHNKSLWFWPFLAVLFLAGKSFAADHYVQSSIGTIDCRSFNGGVKPGDTVTLAAGARGPLTIQNCLGTFDEPILFRNDPSGNGPTVIRRTTASAGGFVFTCRDCEQVVIDGTYLWKGAPDGAYCGAPNGRKGCGIKITSIVAGDAPSIYFMLNGFSKKVTLRGVEIDGRRPDLNTQGVGIHAGDHSIKENDHPQFWREDLLFERNYIHDVHGEGMYIGPNWRDETSPLRNITIRKNLIEDTGRQNIQVKKAIGGANIIHDNVVRRSGLRGEHGQGGGIEMYQGGSNTKIYNNWVEESGMQGIQHYNMVIPTGYGPFTSEIYNNVIYDSGKKYGVEMNGHGIVIGSAKDSARITTKVYNNTIVKTAMMGIVFNPQVTDSIARDNIIADTASAALSLGDNDNVNNFIGSVASVRFMDATNRNFQLRLDSPARDAGRGVGTPPHDFLGVARPQGDMPDQGAFEFLSEVAIPASPESLDVR